VRRILVATDFSRDAERALGAGIELAQAFHATIDILHLYPPVSHVSAQPVSGVFPAAPSPADLEDIGRSLCALVERVTDAGVECRTTIVEGDPAKMIIAQTASVGGDLIVMGTQGRTGLRRLLIGSVAEATLRGAAAPVLVVPSEDAGAPVVPPAPAKLS
jgi:nucleotide-binding universal stress UspA family protein